jgi:hypothetical protein
LELGEKNEAIFLCTLMRVSSVCALVAQREAERRFPILCGVGTRESRARVPKAA